MPPRLRSRTLSAPARSLLFPPPGAQPTPAPVRLFSVSAAACQIPSKGRLDMWSWFDETGNDFQAPSGQPNYLGPMPDQPFPLNPLFRSQSVLDEEARETIWRRVVAEGQPLKVVSVELGVDIRRVAAVVRMKETEKRWIATGKPLARPYAAAIMSMLPKTHYEAGKQNKPHEPINDVPVHRYSLQQLFVPTSESRNFTREDAAKAFHETLLPADARVPHPELVQREKAKLAGVAEAEANARFVEDVGASQQRAVARIRAKAEREEKQTLRVRQGRFEFRFKHVNADNVGGDGRARDAVGWRYGAPLQDRKRGISYVPTQVP